MKVMKETTGPGSTTAVLIFLAVQLQVQVFCGQTNASIFSCTALPTFPTSIKVNLVEYENWSTEIQVQGIWKAVPRTPADIVRLVNWAHQNGYKVRPVGFQHTWAPTTVVSGTNACSKILLVDIIEHLTEISMDPSPVPGSSSVGAIRVQSGVSLVDFLAFAEQHGFGWHNHPGSGDFTIGGILAIGGHGAGVIPVGGTLDPGKTLGSVSNLILELTAVVWNNTTNSYQLKTFSRSGNTEITAFLTHIGRTFITEYVLQVGPLSNLRCQSFTNIPVSQLFAAPGTQTQNKLSNILDSSGALEVILFSYTDKPWLKVWTNSPTKPIFSRKVNQPFNYPFTYNIPKVVSNVIDQINNGLPELTPILGNTLYSTSVAGLISTLSSDIWGPAKNVLLFVKPSTMRASGTSFCVLTTRHNIQQVSHDIFTYYTSLVDVYTQRGEYPVNVAFELRVAGVDGIADIQVPNAQTPILSASSPIPDHPEFDTTIWVEFLSLPSTPSYAKFSAEFEQHLYKVYSSSSSFGFVRPEWSKAWAFTDKAGFSNVTFLQNVLPSLFTQFNLAKSIFHKYDPFTVYANEFLESFLV